MKRLLPLLALALLFAGCGIDSVGFPTVKVNVQKSSLITTTTAGVTTYSRQIILEFRSLPGSPAGTVRNFTTQSGDLFPAGVYLNSCPTSSLTDCGGASVTSTVTYVVADPTQESKIILMSYTAENNNGAIKDFQIPGNGIPVN